MVSLSNHRVLINSNFIGDNLVLFGAIEPDAGKTLRRGGYDLVVTVTGPRVTLRTRRKARVLGIWVNVDSREFVRVPIVSRDPEQPAGDAQSPMSIPCGACRSGSTIFCCRSASVRTSPIPCATIRSARPSCASKASMAFYLEQPNAVTYLTPAVFRAAIALPADVATGNYAIDVKLFADGVLVTRATRRSK